MRGVLVIALMLLAAPARAGCPDPTELTADAISRSRRACRPADRFLVPSVTAGAMHADGTWWHVLGGQLALVSWRHPAPFAGPSHGELTLGAAYAARGPRHMVFLEATARLSPERSAGRTWAIPFVGAAVGKNLSSDAPQAFYLAPLAGVHLAWWAGPSSGHVALSVEGQYHLPLDEFDRLRGGRITLQLAGSWW
jgi:hypothetical protein